VRFLGFTALMAPETRLDKLISTARHVTAARWFRVIGRLLAAALLLLLGLRLWRLWEKHPVDFGSIDLGVFSAAVVVSAVAVGGYGLVWLFVLRRMGVRASLVWITLFFQSQLGKYLPGSVWQYAGRIGLARARGVRTQTAVVSLVVEVAVSALAAGLVGLLVLPPQWAVVVLLLVVLGVVVTVRTLGARHFTFPAWPDGELIRRTLRSLPATGGLYLLVWVTYGSAFWLTGRALFAVSTSDLSRYIGVFALSWLVGLVAVFAPGGIGVREAVIVALLSHRLGEAQAIVLAATSRIILTAIDLVAGALSLSLPLLHRHRVPPSDTDPPQPATSHVGSPR
jgi:glycosyltransferase 2 family protein